MSGKLTVLQNVGLSGVSPHRATLTINQSGPPGPAGSAGESGARRASALLWTPSLTPTIGDDIYLLRWNPGNGNPYTYNNNYEVADTYSWSGTWPGENDDRVLLLVDSDYYPTVYATATSAAFVPIATLGGTPVTVSCEALGGLHAAVYIGFNSDNDLTGGTDVATSATFFLPQAMASDFVSIPTDYDGNLAGLSDARAAFAALDDLPDMRETSEPHGFPNRTDSALSFDNSQREFTITPTGASFDVWCSGTKHTFTAAQSVTLPATSGLYYIYFNGGALGYDTSYFDWPVEAPVAYIYWNNTAGAAQFFADERHGITLDWATHEYLHRTRGAALANGFVLSSYTTTGDGTSNSHATVALTDGTFFDEDLQVDIINDPSPTPNTWEQRLSTTLYAPVFYRTGAGVWTRDTATAYPLKSGASRATYNLNTSGTWTTPDLGNNKYGISWLVATNNLSEPVIALLGQGQYSNVENALEVTWEDMDLTAFPVFEFRPLWKIVYETANSYTNTPKARLRAVQDLRGQLPVSAGAAAADHGSMSGLLDDDHPQYQLVGVDVEFTGTRPVTDETTLVMTAGGSVTLPLAEYRTVGRPLTVMSFGPLTIDADPVNWISNPGTTSLSYGSISTFLMLKLYPYEFPTLGWGWIVTERQGDPFDLPLWYDPVTQTVLPSEGDVVAITAGIPTWVAPTPGAVDERPWFGDALAEDTVRSDALWLRCNPTPAVMDGSYDGTWQITNGSTGTGTLPATPDGIDIRAKFYLHPPYEDSALGVGQAWPYQRYRELLTQTKASATGGDLTEWAVLHSDTSFTEQRINGAAMWFYESTLTGDPGEGPAYNYDDGGRLIGVPVIARLTHDTATETVTFWRWVPYDTGAPGVVQTADDGYWWQPVDSRTDPQYASMDPNGVETWKIGTQNRADFAWITMHEYGGSKILDIQPSDIASAGIGATSFTDGVGNTISTTSGDIGFGAGAIRPHAESHESGGSDALSLDGAQITSGTVDYDRLPIGQVADTIAAGDDFRFDLLGYSNYQVTSFSNADETLNFVRPVFARQIGTLSAPRTVTLPFIDTLGSYNFEPGKSVLLWTGAGVSSTNTMTVEGASSQTINGSATLVLTQPNRLIRFVAANSGTATSLNPNWIAQTFSVDAAEITSGTVDTARLGSGTASSSTFLRGDQTWQSVSGLAERPPSLIVAGQYVATSAVSTGNAGLTSNRLFYAPIYITRTTSFDRIGITHAATTAGAGSVVRLGIYNSTNDLPSTLVLDAGTIDLTTAAAYKEVTISPAQSLSVGVYWLAAVAQITSGSPTFATGNLIMPVPSNNNTFTGTKFEAGVTGALPATATPGATNTTQPPVIFLRAVP